MTIANLAPSVSLLVDEEQVTPHPLKAPHIVRTLPLQEGMSLSHWLESVRNDELLNKRSTEELPATAAVVVIGSGITGTLTALSLLESSTPPESIVLLEAREFCSGATGRNAGHCRPDAFKGFKKFSELFGAENALKILENERQTWEAVVDYVTKHNVNCELWVGKTFDVSMTESVAKRTAQIFDDFAKAGGDTAGIQVIDDPLKAEKITKLHGAQRVYAWDASTLHPWKLTAHLAREALKLGLNLQTWTPVHDIAGTAGSWTVHTERGNITAPIVVHATNAYAAHLLPEAKGAIIPRPQMCNKVLPPSSFSGSNALEHSMGVGYPTGGYSVNPRLNGGGAVFFGGGPPNQDKLYDYVAQDPDNRSTDDGLVNFEPVTDSVRELGTHGFQWDYKPGDKGAKVSYERSWSGIIANSGDWVPFIGAVPNKPGQWMCAGHNGHGMARIFKAAPALAKLIQGATWSETGLPDPFQVTEERLARFQHRRAPNDLQKHKQR